MTNFCKSDDPEGIHETEFLSVHVIVMVVKCVISLSNFLDTILYNSSLK